MQPQVQLDEQTAAGLADVVGKTISVDVGQVPLAVEIAAGPTHTRGQTVRRLVCLTALELAPGVADFQWDRGAEAYAGAAALAFAYAPERTYRRSPRLQCPVRQSELDLARAEYVRIAVTVEIEEINVRPVRA